VLQACWEHRDCTALGLLFCQLDHCRRHLQRKHSEVACVLYFPLQTLAEQWNGTSWSRLTTVSPGALYGVSCPSTSFCVAVGNNGGTTLAEQWNGASWSTMTTTNPGAGRLHAVSCASITFCVAVGYYYNPSSNTDQTLAEQWDGASWSTMTTTDVVVPL